MPPFHIAFQITLGDVLTVCSILGLLWKLHTGSRLVQQMVAQHGLIWEEFCRTRGIPPDTPVEVIKAILVREELKKETHG